jgi:hypothetical protein
MCTLVLLAPCLTAATTEFMPAVRGCPTQARFWLEWERTDFRPPRMNWVVAADGNGNRSMLMRWAPSANRR